MIPCFFTVEDALVWMRLQFEDDCIDNERWAFEDDLEQMLSYTEAKATGCCGSFDTEVMVDNRLMMIGCDYGH